MKFVHAADIHLDSPLRGLDKYPGAPSDGMRLDDLGSHQLKDFPMPELAVEHWPAGE